MLHRALLLAVGLTVAAGFSCTAGVQYEATVSSTVPPAPYDEYVHPAPSPEYVWVSCYWWWDGVRYVWVRGRWAYPPESGYIWVRSGWVIQDGSYVFVHGRWSRPGARNHTRYRYVHPRPNVEVKAGARYRTSPRRAPPRPVRRPR